MGKERFTFFWSTNSPFSNWHLAKFTVEGTEFSSSEQFMMYRKALLFNDPEKAEQILKSKNPRKQKALGREVSNFNPKVWESRCKEIVYEANHAKFTQNPHLLEILLKTQGTTLVEASPDDRIWGIGLAEEDPRAKSRDTWEGKNWLGEILTRLREDLLKNNL